MNTDSVKFVSDSLVCTRRGQEQVINGNTIEELFVCTMEDEIHHGDEQFHVILLPNAFWLVGPFVAGALDAIESLRKSHPSLPVGTAIVHRLRRKFRERGLLGLRLYPIAGFGRFPREELPHLDLEEVEDTSE